MHRLQLVAIGGFIVGRTAAAFLVGVVPNLPPLRGVLFVNLVPLAFCIPAWAYLPRVGREEDPARRRSLALTLGAAPGVLLVFPILVRSWRGWLLLGLPVLATVELLWLLVLLGPRRERSLWKPVVTAALLVVVLVLLWFVRL